jgi:hypothetical protein
MKGHRRRPTVLRDNREASDAMARVTNMIAIAAPHLVAKADTPAKRPFNSAGEIHSPGKMVCGACGHEIQGEDALDTLMLLIVHLRGVPDEAHRAEIKWLREAVMRAYMRAKLFSGAQS